MTPTLRGRWETRFFLLTVLGVPVTALFAWWYGDGVTPFALLGYVLLLGWGWDMIYYALQLGRWNRDWPPLFVLLSGLWEGLFVWGLVNLFWWQGVTMPGVAVGLTFGRFAGHYLTVFLVTWAAVYSVLPLLFPRWRFRGGQWLSGWE
ncbi:MAG: hypothetical protein H6658_09180 [Ardenticatenaceae bacterium]|nr:hypothetical protein [Ardenticatenaceae bacterium]